MISALSLFVMLNDLRCANHSATSVKQTTCDVYAFVEATESSLPQLINTPQSFSLANVLLTLLTTFIL
jgi:hypothetical protein